MIRAVLALAALLLAVPAAAGTERLAGRWMLSAAGRPVAVMTIVHDAAGWRVDEERWRGELSGDGTVSALQPERRRLHYRVTAATADRLDLADDEHAADDLDRHVVFRLIDGDIAERQTVAFARRRWCSAG